MGTYENPTNAGDGYAMAYHAGAAAREPRMLPDQPAHQGLQRPRLRLCDRPARRLYGEWQGRALHRMRLLERPDDVGVLPGTAERQRPGVPQARSPRRRNDPDHRDDPAHERAPEPRTLPRADAAPTIAQQMVEMHISEIGFCSGHSASGVWVNERARDHGARPVRRRRHGRRAAQLHAGRVHLRLVRGRQRGRTTSRAASCPRSMKSRSKRERARVFAPLERDDRARRRRRSNTSCAAW